MYTLTGEIIASRDPGSVGTPVTIVAEVDGEKTALAITLGTQNVKGSGTAGGDCHHRRPDKFVTIQLSQKTGSSVPSVARRQASFFEEVGGFLFSFGEEFGEFRIWQSYNAPPARCIPFTLTRAPPGYRLPP